MLHGNQTNEILYCISFFLYIGYGIYLYNIRINLHRKDNIFWQNNQLHIYISPWDITQHGLISNTSSVGGIIKYAVEKSTKFLLPISVRDPSQEFTKLGL